MAGLKISLNNRLQKSNCRAFAVGAGNMHNRRHLQMRVADFLKEGRDAFQREINFAAFLFKFVEQRGDFVLRDIVHWGNLKYMFGKVIIFVLLFACWFAISGETGAFYIISGIVSSLIVVSLTARMEMIPKLAVKIGIIPYWFWLAGQVAKSGFDVVLRVWGLKGIAPVLEEVTTGQNTEIGDVIYGNSVTLTPGTMTIEVGNGKLLVHAISHRELDILKSGEMDRRVLAVAGRKK